ncbi:MAG: SRPBCC family protein [Candidatus Obscuribacter sp.]|nr:SRPBCC family protein [Candidatus Obscuribacter sp.]
MFKKIALTVIAITGIGVAVVLAMAAAKPDNFRVERSTTISAAPDKISGLISDFHQWDKWSPYEKLDATMTRQFSGKESGVGAIYEWTGNDKVGQGKMEILKVTPEKIEIKLDFIKPFEASNTAEFLLQPVAGGTKVTWAMSGKSQLFCKVMDVLFTMDKMCGTDFETGLANLKVATEAKAEPHG